MDAKRDNSSSSREAEFSYLSPSTVNEIFRLIDEEEQKTKEELADDLFAEMTATQERAMLAAGEAAEKSKEDLFGDSSTQVSLEKQMIAAGEAAESVATSKSKEDPFGESSTQVSLEKQMIAAGEAAESVATSKSKEDPFGESCTQKDLEREMIAAGEAAESVATSNVKPSLKNTKERSKEDLFGDDCTATQEKLMIAEIMKVEETMKDPFGDMTESQEQRIAREAEEKIESIAAISKSVLEKTQQRSKDDLEMSISLEYELLDVAELAEKKIEEEKQGFAPMSSPLEEAIIKEIEKYEEAELYLWWPEPVHFSESQERRMLELDLLNARDEHFNPPSFEEEAESPEWSRAEVLRRIEARKQEEKAKERRALEEMVLASPPVLGVSEKKEEQKKQTKAGAEKSRKLMGPVDERRKWRRIDSSSSSEDEGPRRIVVRDVLVHAPSDVRAFPEAGPSRTVRRQSTKRRKTWTTQEEEDMEAICVVGEERSSRKPRAKSEKRKKEETKGEKKKTEVVRTTEEPPQEESSKKEDTREEVLGRLGWFEMEETTQELREFILKYLSEHKEEYAKVRAVPVPPGMSEGSQGVVGCPDAPASESCIAESSPAQSSSDSIDWAAEYEECLQKKEKRMAKIKKKLTKTQKLFEETMKEEHRAKRQKPRKLDTSSSSDDE